MKKHQNLKIRPAYKTLALLLLFGLMGCVVRHKNEIIEIGTVNGETVAVLKDVETGVERIYKADTDLKYDHLGDSVILFVDFRFEETYRKSRVLNSSDILCFLNDSVDARRKSEESDRLAREQDANFDSIRQQMKMR